MTPDKELKPCPFCGGEGETHKQSFSLGRVLWGVMCNGDCGVWFDCRQETPEAAIFAWNTRADQSPPLPDDVGESSSKGVIQAYIHYQLCAGKGDSRIYPRHNAADGGGDGGGYDHADTRLEIQRRKPAAVLW